MSIFTHSDQSDNIFPYFGSLTSVLYLTTVEGRICVSEAASSIPFDFMSGAWRLVLSLRLRKSWIVRLAYQKSSWSDRAREYGKWKECFESIISIRPTASTLKSIERIVIDSKTCLSPLFNVNHLNLLYSMPKSTPRPCNFLKFLQFLNSSFGSSPAENNLSFLFSIASEPLDFSRSLT